MVNMNNKIVGAKKVTPQIEEKARKPFLETERTVDEIIAVLCGRGGFDDWWYNLDVERRIEVRDLCKIIMDYSDSVLHKR